MAIITPALPPKDGYRIVDVDGVQTYTPTPSLVKIVIGTYTGTGTYGSSNNNTLTFDFVPKVVIISAQTIQSPQSGYSMIIPQGAAGAVSLTGSAIDSGVTAGSGVALGGQNVVSWSNNGKTVNWYYDGGSYSSYNFSGCQMNYSSIEYSYLAIG